MELSEYLLMHIYEHWLKETYLFDKEIRQMKPEDAIIKPKVAHKFYEYLMYDLGMYNLSGFNLGSADQVRTALRNAYAKLIIA